MPVEYSFYIDDSRYSVPTLKMIPAEDDAAAIELGRRMFEASTHYRGLEILRDGARIFAVGSYEHSEPRRPRS